MSKPRAILIAGMAIVAVAVIVFFAVNRASIFGITPAAKRDSGQPQISAGGTPQLVTLAMPPSVLPAILIDPLELPSTKLRRLAQNPDPFDAQMQAVRSGDPLLIVLAPYIYLHCLDTVVHFYGKDIRAWHTQNSFDAKTGKPVPPSEDVIRFTEAQMKAGLQRIYPPEPVRSFVSAQLSAGWPREEKPNYAALESLWTQMAVPMTPPERAFYDARVAQAASECRDRGINSDFGAEYRAARDRLVAKNVVSALLFNHQAGWSSDGTGNLNERDYELVQRALNEWQPDGIARLLVGGIPSTGAINTQGLPADAIGAVLLLDFSVGTLAACHLGIMDCSPDSTRFRSLCHSAGGCDQPDMAAQLRYVFERDGLDSSVIDREMMRVVTAYRNRDLEALGIRRAREKK